MDGLELAATFRGKRVLVTGDTGFKGSWLSLWLCELGAEVCGLALPPENEPCHFTQIGLPKLTRHLEVDIRNYEALSRVFSSYQPEIVFHLAAQSLVGRSYKDPRGTVDTNVLGGTNVLEAIRETPSIHSAVFITSDKCYRNREWSWSYRENDELGGHDLYSASKAAIEILCSAYQDSFFSSMKDLGFATARAGNVIGGGDWSQDRIIPDAMRALSPLTQLKHSPLRLRNPEATRPWQHVLEPLWGYLSLAAHQLRDPKNFNGAWNFGPNSTSVHTVSELLSEVSKHWNRVSVSSDKAAGYHEAHLLGVNCEKAASQLGWRPLWEFETSVRETVLWYRRVSDGESPAVVSRDQIRNYTQLRAGRS